ncbi:MAG: YlxR family protein [Chloroflexi bacterium]|nr:YlxR family protein [Chloroflexota bacterium]
MPKANPGRKREPQRTCVACRRVGGKEGLLRIAASADGRIAVGQAAKGWGRGAYLCPSAACWSRGITTGQLGRALRVKLDPQTTEALMAYGANLGGKKEVSS